MIIIFEKDTISPPNDVMMLFWYIAAKNNDKVPVAINSYCVWNVFAKSRYFAWISLDEIEQDDVHGHA